MKPSPASHTKLVEIARKWLLRKHPIVVTEMATTGEEPDAIGWTDGMSSLIECKATRPDFKADGKKAWRMYDHHGIGAYRYLLANTGVIKSVEELPDRWGWLEYRAGKVFHRQCARVFAEYNTRHEIRLLMSALRRIGHYTPKGISCQAYYIDGGNRASLSIDLESEELA